MHKFEFERKTMLNAWFTIYLAMFLAMVMVGCSTPAPNNQTSKPVFVAPSDDLILDCETTPPPAPSVYMTHVPAKSTSDVDQLIAALKTSQQREKLALDWGRAQTENLGKCTIRMRGIRTFKSKAIEGIKALDVKKE